MSYLGSIEVERGKLGIMIFSHGQNGLKKWLVVVPCSVGNNKLWVHWGFWGIHLHPTKNGPNRLAS